jgi:hypothetical protein
MNKQTVRRDTCRMWHVSQSQVSPVPSCIAAERQRRAAAAGMESKLSPPCAANKHPKPRRAPQTKTTATAHAFPCLLQYERRESKETHETANLARPSLHRRVGPSRTASLSHASAQRPGSPAFPTAAPGFRPRNGPVITRKSRAHPSAPPRYKRTGGASSANPQNQTKVQIQHTSKAKNLRKTPGNRIIFSPTTVPALLQLHSAAPPTPHLDPLIRWCSIGPWTPKSDP